MFFMRLQSIYGVGKYREAFPDKTAERSAMREWAPDILALTDEQLETRLWYAKGMMHQKEWQWPDIGRILAGSSAGGQAELSYRPVDEVLGLPKPPLSDERKAKARSRLAALRDSLGPSTAEVDQVEP